MMPIIDKRIHSAGFVDPDTLSVRPIGLRTFNYDFLAVTISGEAFFLVKENGLSSIVKKISMVYVPAGKRHLYDPRDRKSWKNYWVLFDREAVNASFHKLLPTPGITVLNEFDTIEDHWNKMILCTLENDVSAKEHAFCLLHNILYEISRQSVTSDRNKKSSSVKYTLDIMHKNLREAELNYEKIANSHGICLDTLRKRFKRETNVSLHQYFIQLKINAAKIMLSNLSYNISDIAGFLGFEDPYYFSRLFKNKTNFSPKKYRESLNNEQELILESEPPLSENKRGALTK